jgi:hypothetical protein
VLSAEGYMADLAILPPLARSDPHEVAANVRNFADPPRISGIKDEEAVTAERSDRVEIGFGSLWAFAFADNIGPLRPTSTSQSFEEVERVVLAELPKEQVERIRAQGVRLRQVISLTIESTSNDASAAPSFGQGAQTQADGIEELDPYYWKYLALIRALSKDDEDLERFLNSVDEFLSSNPQNGRGVVEFFDGNGDQFVLRRGSQSSAIFTSSELRLETKVEVESAGTTMTWNEFQAQATGAADPLVLDLDGDGIELTSARQGAEFDITGDGKTERTAFVKGNDAFLAIDKNRNGEIDNGSELFGDQHGAPNGFEELAKYDSNQDGLIDEHDAVYDRLLLLTGRDRNGQFDAGRLQTLHQAGIASISLSYLQASSLTSGGNRLSQVGYFTRFDGGKGTAADAIVSYLA